MTFIPRTTVFRSRQRARCQELWAVLDAAGIPADIDAGARQYLLVVADQDLERAVRELYDYAQEGPLRQPPRALPPAQSGGWIGILVYAITLVTVAGMASRSLSGADWFEAGRIQAGAMVDGEWWRALTALTLHVDIRHLMGNLFFGSVFGLMAAQALGGGVTWLAILLGGALGNIANALIQDPQHSAVGASTAVFAGLGLLIALALYHKRGTQGGILRRLSPLYAGLLLLAWTGFGGERTDVLAHVTGLVAGLAVGAIGGLVPAIVLQRRSVQVGASVVALAMLALAWVVALS